MSKQLKSHLPAPFHKLSVASVVIIALVTVTTLLLGSFGFVNYLSERTRQEAKLRHNLNLDAGQFSAALALPVWNFDRAQIDKVIESMMQDQTICGVVVKLADAKKTILARAREADGTPQVLDREFPTDGYLMEKREINFGGVTLGTMKLFVTTRFMEAELKDTLVSTFLKILALDLVLTVSLYFLLWRGVLKPLRALEAYALAVSSGNGRDLELRPGTYQGELESLRTSIHKMIGLLDARYIALQKQEMMLLSVLNAVPQFIFWKDRDSVYLGCNKVFANAVGLASPEDVVGKTDFDLPLPKHEAEADRSADQEIMRQAKARKHLVEPAQLADGARIWVDTSKVPLLDREGRAYGILGVFEDITDRKRAEEALGRQLAFDEIIQRQLARFASSTGAEVDELILDCLQELAWFMELDLAFVGQIADDGATWSATHEWHAPGIPSRRHRFQNRPMNTWNIQRLLAGKTVRIERLDDLPPEGAAMRPQWEAEGFKSVFQVPLLGRGERVKGGVGLISIGREAVCEETDMQRLTIVSAAIANVLERHRAEEDLRRSEVRYRTLFEAAQDAIFISNGQFFMDCNPHALEMFRCRREELIGQSPVNFSPAVQPDGQDSTAKAYEKIQAALSGLPQHFDWRHRRLDGTEFDAEVNLNRIDLDHQSLMLGIVRDITQRKQAEAAMRVSEEKFSKAFRASPDPMSIVEWDSCRIVDTNGVFEKCFGWSRQEAIGSSSLDLGLWAEPEARRHFLAKLDERGSVKNFQMVAQTRNNRRFACLVSAEQVEINGKKSMIIVSEDITERQEMEDALRLSEDRFRSAMQHSPIGMALLAPDGRWLEVNPALCAILGYTREELLALDFQTITHREDLAADRAAVQQLLSRQIESYQSEKRYVHKSGRAIWIQLNVSLVFNPDGTQRNFVCQIQDVTERKRAEQRMQKSRQQLRALSARLQSLREEERTHLAREIHDHLGQLLTALKLDLRSIERKLPALGDAELIAALNGKLASARELTDETIKSIQQIASELRPAILDRLGLEAAIDAETQAFESRTGIPCESSIPDCAVPTAPEQATAVYRIFQEILTNIARHAHASHVDVCLSRENGSLVLVVRDDGVGMQPSDLENPKSLGLLGMQERAEILGGHLRFGPTDGKGTTVTMSIPLNGKVGREA